MLTKGIVVILSILPRMETTNLKKDADQTAHMCRLFCVFVIYKQAFSWKKSPWSQGEWFSTSNLTQHDQWYTNRNNTVKKKKKKGERGGSVVECRTPEREVGGSKPTAAVLCPWARHLTPRKYWLITQEAVAPSRHDWKIVDWDVKPQHNQPIL